MGAAGARARYTDAHKSSPLDAFDVALYFNTGFLVGNPGVSSEVLLDRESGSSFEMIP